MTQVHEVMTRGVRAVTIHDSVLQAARAMEELDIGALPVCDAGVLVGMVTDRDLVVRAVAHGCAPEETRLGEVMTRTLRWCYEDQTLESATEEMRSAQIRRIPVLDRQGRLVGMVSLADVAIKSSEASAGCALRWISEPSRSNHRGRFDDRGGLADGGWNQAGQDLERRVLSLR